MPLKYISKFPEVDNLVYKRYQILRVYLLGAKPGKIYVKGIGEDFVKGLDW